MIITCKKDKICKIEKKMSVVRIKMETGIAKKQIDRMEKSKRKSIKGRKIYKWDKVIS